MGKTFDDLLVLTGDAGWWQFRNFLLLCFSGFPGALQSFIYIFIAATPDHWCHISPCGSLAYEELKNLTIPRVEYHGKYKFSHCARYMPIMDGNGGNDSCTSPEVSFDKLVPCDGFDYDRSTFEETITTEWNLVCGDEAWRSTSQAAYFIGTFVGSFIFSTISDNYGRKRAVTYATLLCTLLGPAASVAPTFSLFLAARFLGSVGAAALFGAPCVLVMESISKQWRGTAGLLFAVPFSLGYASCAVFGYFFTHWRHLQLIPTVPMLMFLIMMYFVPESPRWLVNQGRAKEAETILRKIAKSNGQTLKLPDNFAELVGNLAAKATKNEPQQKSFKDRLAEVATLVKTPRMRCRTLALSFCWFAISVVYNGGAFNAPNLSANLFIYTLVSGVLEIPAYLIVLPLMRILGRRIVFSGLFLICAAALLASLPLKPGSVAIVVLAWIGIFSIGGAYALIFVFGAEVMPTSVRSTGLSVASLFGKAGSVGGLYVAGLLGGMVPTMVMSIIALAAGLVALTLPETNKKTLPENVEDVENQNG